MRVPNKNLRAVPFLGRRTCRSTQLRFHLDELPHDRQLIAYCQVGMRGYFATRLLKQRGFDAANLAGGYQTYQQFIDQRRLAARSHDYNLRPSHPLPRLATHRRRHSR